MLINEGKYKDGSLPKWDAIDAVRTNSKTSQQQELQNKFVDSYGFIYDRSNEIARLNYLCEKLVHFYDNESKISQENFWSMKIKEWQSIPAIDAKSKSLIRKGISPPYRGRVWKFAIQKQVETIKKTKGFNYFDHLCNISGESIVLKKFHKQIAIDLHRTMPNNVKFANKNSNGVN